MRTFVEWARCFYHLHTRKPQHEESEKDVINRKYETTAAKFTSDKHPSLFRNDFNCTNTFIILGVDQGSMLYFFLSGIFEFS